MKTSLPAILLLVVFVLPVFAFTLTPAAETSASPAASDVKVKHVVQIREGGLVVISDTVKFSTNPGENSEPLQDYALGFPYDQLPNLNYAYAYETSDPNSTLKLELDVGMGRVGFYGVNVVFPEAINISDGGSYAFTVVFVFSNTISLIEGYDTPLYNASFPAYPSLTQSASEANLTIIFPVGLDYALSSFESEGVNFTQTVIDSRRFFSYTKSNLSEFSDRIAWFIMAKADSALEILEVSEAKRNIEFIGSEKIVVSDSYKVVSKADRLAKIRIILPPGAFDITVYNETGMIPTKNLKTESGRTYKNLTVTFESSYDKDKEARLFVDYQLPWKNFTETKSWSEIHVSVTYFEDFDWVIKKLSTTVTLPEGASLLSLPSSPSLNSFQNDAFKSSFSFSFENVTPFHDLSLDFKYKREIFWESFRPTLWMGALVIFIGAIVAAWQVYHPKAAPVPTAIIPVRVEDLKSFVDSYDEKRRYQQELESLESAARKGKIPRRRYKVRRLTIESRLTSLSRALSALREKIRTASPGYADFMRQLEVAETELEGVEANLSRTEVRYRRGEISAPAYHKLLEDLYRRRDRTQTTIEGVLLRLREQIS